MFEILNNLNILNISLYIVYLYQNTIPYHINTTVPCHLKVNELINFKRITCRKEGNKSVGRR